MSSTLFPCTNYFIPLYQSSVFTYKANCQCAGFVTVSSFVTVLDIKQPSMTMWQGILCWVEALDVMIWSICILFCFLKCKSVWKRAWALESIDGVQEPVFMTVALKRSKNSLPQSGHWLACWSCHEYNQAKHKIYALSITYMCVHNSDSNMDSCYD